MEKGKGANAPFPQSVDKVLAPQRALFSRSVSGIKKASFARFFDTFDSIGSVVPIERLSKTMFFDSLRERGVCPFPFFRFVHRFSPCATNWKPGAKVSHLPLAKRAVNRMPRHSQSATIAIQMPIAPSWNTTANR